MIKNMEGSLYKNTNKLEYYISKKRNELFIKKFLVLL